MHLYSCCIYQYNAKLLQAIVLQIMFSGESASTTTIMSVHRVVERQRWRSTLACYCAIEAEFKEQPMTRCKSGNQCSQHRYTTVEQYCVNLILVRTVATHLP